MKVMNPGWSSTRKQREYACQHQDHRTKVTMADFWAARLKNTIPELGLAAAHLLASPPDLPRDKLSERVPLKPKTLEQRARKFLTLADEYAERERYRKAMLEPEPAYQTRLWRLTGHLFTRQSKPQPFETGRNTLPGMERFAQ